MKLIYYYLLHLLSKVNLYNSRTVLFSSTVMSFQNKRLIIKITSKQSCANCVVTFNLLSAVAVDITGAGHLVVVPFSLNLAHCTWSLCIYQRSQEIQFTQKR